MRDWSAWSKDERRAFTRWSPLALCLPGLDGWSGDELAALAEVMRKKGARRDSEYVRALDAHKKLRTALRKLAAAVST